jgi:lipoate-protein ligase A
MERLPFLRQIIDAAPNSGAWNMAVDQVLLQSAIDQGIATVRWYRWREPTVSMGYFQREEELLQDESLAGLPRVRRLSGGGTLVHDHELTYSLALPLTQRLIERPPDLYRLVHQVFINEFQRRGVNLQMRGQTVKLAEEPVLCFDRHDENDLVLRGHKVLGSAQRRRRGAILQHGGLLLKASAATPQLPGVTDLYPDADLNDLAQCLGAAILQEIAISGADETLTPSESQIVATAVGDPSN